MLLYLELPDLLFHGRLVPLFTVLMQDMALYNKIGSTPSRAKGSLIMTVDTWEA